MTRAALAAGALCLATSAPATAQPDIAALTVAKKRLHVRAGSKIRVAGTVQPVAAGHVARLQIHRRGAWRTIDRDLTGSSGRYVLRDRLRRPLSARARLEVAGRHRRLGLLNVYRWARASWYGPGLYGNPLGCGGTLTPGRVGVAHRTLPCRSRLTLRHRGRSVRVRVIDRGPYVGGREYDLTAATAQRLRFRGHGAILTTR